LVAIWKRFLDFGIHKSSPEQVEPATGRDQDLGSLLLGLFGLESGPLSGSAPAEGRTPIGEDFRLCPTCEAEVAKWTGVLAEQAEKEAEEEFRTRVVYDALACFASGALMGIVFGILRD